MNGTFINRLRILFTIYLKIMTIFYIVGLEILINFVANKKKYFLLKILSRKPSFL